MGLVASPRGLRTIVLPKASRRTVERALKPLGVKRQASGEPPSRLTPHVSRLTPVLREAQAQIVEFLAGRRCALEFPIDLSGGTPFQRRVWRTILAVPYGRARSYKWVAARIGGARYARAVGLALGANPVPLIVPCHRILASDGSLGGFSGGLRTKRRLLALEGTLAQLAPGKRRGARG